MPYIIIWLKPFCAPVCIIIYIYIYNPYIYIYVCHCVNEINMYDMNIIITYTCVWSLYPAPFAAAHVQVRARGGHCMQQYIMTPKHM